MKQLIRCLALAGCLSFTSLLTAQSDSVSMAGFSAKVLFIDYNTPNSIDGFKVSNGVEVAYLRNFNDNLAFGLPVKIGLANLDGSDEKTTLFSGDLIGQVQITPAAAAFRPYLFAGMGVVFENFDRQNIQVPLGAGFFYKISGGSYLNLQFEYRKSLEEQRDNLQLGLGFYFKLKAAPVPVGPVDTDADGLPDKQDGCPNEPGALLAGGCPDTDEDGIPNRLDDCPTMRGPESNYGCPVEGDRDGDGVIDTEDKCPDQPGLASLYGCPAAVETPAEPSKPTSPAMPAAPGTSIDTDGDGLVNDRDDCPDVAGKIVLMGCPDTDGDGILDKNDRCPDEFGPQERNGCPPKDSDKDGVLDEDDDCPAMYGKTALRGCPDADNDGIADYQDECPGLVGKASANGCPDADGDGIADLQDTCPREAGSPENNGCPIYDADNDGVWDKDDLCPAEKGPAANRGCPDTDGDGITNNADQCPTVAGPASAKGCPDEDGDGMADQSDKCPGEKGTNQGCPDISTADQEFLAFAARNVQFDAGKSSLKAQSFSILDRVAAILATYPRYRLEIDGHTDNQGGPNANLALSAERAQSCYEYLLAKGVGTERMLFKGYGEARPIDSNNTPEGREANRRVEFNLYLK